MKVKCYNLGGEAIYLNGNKKGLVTIGNIVNAGFSDFYYTPGGNIILLTLEQCRYLAYLISPNTHSIKHEQQKLKRKIILSLIEQYGLD